MHAEIGSRNAVPLASHVLFQSNDLDCARERVAQKFCRHRLDIIGGKTAFRAVHHHVPGDFVSLNYISYGADVLIDPGELGDFYLIQMPLSGAATIRNGGKEFVTDRGTASILNADLATRMRWWQGCAQILIQVRKAPFLDFAERMLGRELPGPLVFDPLIDLSRPEMQAWRGFANGVFHAAEVSARAPGESPLNMAYNEQRLMELFLSRQPSNISLFMNERLAGPSPRHLRRADEYIRANAARPVTLLDLAEAAGVNARTLQIAYRKAYGRTPMQALQRERLLRVRFDLLSEGEESTVTELATRWGFTHLGRFAADYRNAFGELPRQTRQGAGAGGRPEN